LRRIVNAMGNRADFGWKEALSAVERRPEISTGNRRIQQKALEEC